MKLQELLRKQLQNEEFARVWYETEASFKAGTLLVKLRAQYNLSQAELAEKAGLKRSYIARIESGTANPTVQTLSRILASLQLSLVLDSEPREYQVIPASTLSVSLGEETGPPSVHLSSPYSAYPTDQTKISEAGIEGAWDICIPTIEETESA